MRLLWKLALLVTIGVGMQVAIERYESELDEAWFATRVFCAHARGGTAADPELIDLATALTKRQYARIDPRLFAVPCQKPTTRPADVRQDARVAEELQCSLEAEHARGLPDVFD